MADFSIRPATVADLRAINDIFNYYIARSTCAYLIEPESLESRERWFADHGEYHPVLVATEETGRVVGWGSLSPFHRRKAYENTVEDSVYIHHAWHRRGIGRAMLAELIHLARRIGHHAIMGLIDSEQAGSIALHAAMGFEIVGRLKEVGFKFGRWLDVVYMEKML